MCPIARAIFNTAEPLCWLASTREHERLKVLRTLNLRAAAAAVETGPPRVPTHPPAAVDVAVDDQSFARRTHGRLVWCAGSMFVRYVGRRDTRANRCYFAGVYFRSRLYVTSLVRGER